MMASLTGAAASESKLTNIYLETLLNIQYNRTSSKRKRVSRLQNRKSGSSIRQILQLSFHILHVTDRGYHEKGALK